MHCGHRAAPRRSRCSCCSPPAAAAATPVRPRPGLLRPARHRWRRRHLDPRRWGEPRHERQLLGPAAPLAWNALLTQRRRRPLSGHGGAKPFLARQSLDGRTAAGRISATGCAWAAVGENIPAGSGQRRRRDARVARETRPLREPAERAIRRCRRRLRARDLGHGLQHLLDDGPGPGPMSRPDAAQRVASSSCCAVLPAPAAAVDAITPPPRQMSPS
jgi:hypothetical protein